MRGAPSYRNASGGLALWLAVLGGFGVPHAASAEGVEGAPVGGAQEGDAGIETLRAAAARARGKERAALLNQLASNLAFKDSTGSLEAAREAAREARAAGDRQGEMQALYHASYAHRALGAFGQALEAAEASMELALGLGDHPALAAGHDLLGLTLFRTGQLDEALGAHLDAFAIRETLGDRQGMAYSYNNLGNLYRRLGDTEAAIRHHQLSLELKVSLGDRVGEAYSHENLGNVYRDLARHDDALESYHRSRRIREELGNRGGLASVLVGIGIVLEALDDPAGALGHYDQALELWRQTRNPHGEAVALLNIGRASTALGEHERALEALSAALTGFEAIAARLRAGETLVALAELAVARQRPEEALAHLRRRIALDGEGVRSDLASRLAHARVERRRATELERRQRERNTLAAFSVLLVLLTAVMTYAYRLRRDSERRYQEKAEALARSVAETRVLRGLLPMCSWCKRIRDDVGYWEQLEVFIRNRSEAEFTHGLCPSCAEEHFPDLAEGAGATGPAGRDAEQI